jgi:hypothetical protein
MKCKNGHETSPGARFCKDCGSKPHQSMNKRPWLYALTALIVLGASIGIGAKVVIHHHNAAIAKVQLQARVDRDAAAAKAKAAAAKVKADAAAKAATAAAKAKQKAKQDAALAKAQKDAADAKATAQRAQAQANTQPQVIVVPGPASGAPYYDSSGASATMNAFFNGITTGDYATAYAQLGANERAIVGSLGWWTKGVAGNVDTDVVVNSVSNLGGGTIVANVSFHSGGQWNIDYTLVPGPGAGGYQIDAISNVSH